MVTVPHPEPRAGAATKRTMMTTNSNPERTETTTGWTDHRACAHVAFASSPHAIAATWFGTYAGTTKRHRRLQENPSP
jgi:hypothetical protein